MCINAKIIIIGNDYHDIRRLLLLMIIFNYKNWTISIIIKENITVNRQNRITRNEVTFLYVLLECFKWISTYFKANNAINPYNIDSL